MQEDSDQDSLQCPSQVSVKSSQTTQSQGHSQKDDSLYEETSAGSGELRNRINMTD